MDGSSFLKLVRNTNPVRKDDKEASSVLIVDDSHLNVIAMNNVVNLFDIYPDLASDGLEAIELVKQRLKSNQPMYKMMLIDYCMPHMDAPNTVLLIKKILKESNVQEQPHICCVTSYNQKEFKIRSKEVGMDDFLLKPLEKLEIEVQLRKAGILARSN